MEINLEDLVIEKPKIKKDGKKRIMVEPVSSEKRIKANFNAELMAFCSKISKIQFDINEIQFDLDSLLNSFHNLCEAVNIIKDLHGNYIDISDEELKKLIEPF